MVLIQKTLVHMNSIWAFSYESSTLIQTILLNKDLKCKIQKKWEL